MPRIFILLRPRIILIALYLVMNRIKNVFHRSQKPMEERRPHQFIKRHSSTRTYNSSSNDTFETTQANEPPAINLSDLSEMERPAYQSWWKDLDPFNIGRINNQTILKFLKGCTLEDDKLEQVMTHTQADTLFFLWTE